MNIFRNLTLTWWQAGLFKWGVFLLGIVVGTCWHVFFLPYAPILLAISVVLLAYVTVIWLKQVSR